jgi:class 3 adenylate cyclase
MFADLVGFTAWSSIREPTQVFTLLETIYRAFDEAARQRGVFKVETIGDCYVAVVGLPEARKDHAVVMVKFAKDCQRRMVDLLKQLQCMLGPDTADL